MQSLIYVNIIGKNSKDEVVYEFYFSDEPETFWMIDADVKPASICNLGVPDKQMYDFIKTLNTDITLNVAQRNSCFSIQDCRDKIIPIAWENIDGYDEYPENGRIVLPFGLDIDNVEKLLSLRGLSFDDKNNNLDF